MRNAYNVKCTRDADFFVKIHETLLSATISKFLCWHSGQQVHEYRDSRSGRGLPQTRGGSFHIGATAESFFKRKTTFLGCNRSPRLLPSGGLGISGLARFGKPNLNAGRMAFPLMRLYFGSHCSSLLLSFPIIQAGSCCTLKSVTLTFILSLKPHTHSSFGTPYTHYCITQ